jgi:hypothetical protein
MCNVEMKAKEPGGGGDKRMGDSKKRIEIERA